MRPVLFLFAQLLFALSPVSGQEKQEIDSAYHTPAERINELMIPGVDTSEIYQIVPVMPQFPSGEAKMFKYIAENLDFPMLDSNEMIMGRITIEFVIDENRKVRDAKVKSKVAPQIAREMIHVINAMPLWTPGEKDGNRVRVLFVLPIHVCYQ